MPDQLQAIVQRMIDAGEPEENIATVVQHYKTQTPEPAWKGYARAGLDTLPGIGGIAGGVLSTPETIGVGTLPGMALGVAAGQGLRDVIGHATGLDAPSTPLEKTGRLVKAGGEAAATGAILPGLVEAARAPIQTLREGAEQFGSAMPAGIRRLGRLMPSLPTPAEKPILARPAWQSWESGAGAAPEAATSTPASPGLNLTGKVAPNRSGVPGQMASYDELKAAVDRGELSPNVLAAYEKRAGVQPMPSHEPVAPRATTGAQPGDHPLMQPRIDVGAEKVGRSQGLSMEQVRQQTGPVLDETPGDASPILPQTALNRIVDDLKALPPGPQREAYVARATSGKAKAQVENVRRTLERLGLVAPLALSGDLREALLSKMRGSAAGEQGNQDQ